MRTGVVVSRRKLMAPFRTRDHGLRRGRLRKRWQDDWNYLMSNPANAKWIMDSIAEADLWRKHRGAPAFVRRYRDEENP